MVPRYSRSPRGTALGPRSAGAYRSSLRGAADGASIVGALRDREPTPIDGTPTPLAPPRGTARARPLKASASPARGASATGRREGPTMARDRGSPRREPSGERLV